MRIATVLNGINKENTAVGYYLDQSGIAHGFVVTQGGHLTSIDFPDSTATYAYGTANIRNRNFSGLMVTRAKAQRGGC